MTEELVVGLEARDLLNKASLLLADATRQIAECSGQSLMNADESVFLADEILTHHLSDWEVLAMVGTWREAHARLMHARASLDSAYKSAAARTAVVEMLTGICPDQGRETWLWVGKADPKSPRVGQLVSRTLGVSPHTGSCDWWLLELPAPWDAVVNSAFSSYHTALSVPMPSNAVIETMEALWTPHEHNAPLSAPAAAYAAAVFLVEDGKAD